MVFLDPQFREVLDYLDFGNEGARQNGRAELPTMSRGYVVALCKESARVLKPHLDIADDVLKPVSLAAWDNLRLGMGKRFRSRGDYLMALQKPPIGPQSWRDHGIPSRWPDDLDYSSEHLIRSMPEVHRIKWLRRSIGVSPALFARIPRHPHGRERYHRTVRLIWTLEAALLGELRKLNDSAERRLRESESR